MNLFKKLFEQKEKKEEKKEIINSHSSLVALKEKIEFEENIIIDNAGYLSALEAWESLNDGSEFMEQLKKDLIRGGIEKAKIAIFCKRNLTGKDYEKNKKIDEAIKEYEENISDDRVNTITDYPFRRLFIIYRKMKDYDNEIRVLRKAIKTFTELENLAPSLKNSESYRKRTEKDCEQYKIRLEKVLILKDKNK
jgi:tetratricopeptide (TPR) repeat protein